MGAERILQQNSLAQHTPREHFPERTKEKGFAPPPCAVSLAMCRRYRGTLSCAGRASGGGGQSPWSDTGVWVSPVSEGGKKVRIFFSYVHLLKFLLRFTRRRARRRATERLQSAAQHQRYLRSEGHRWLTAAQRCASPMPPAPATPLTTQPPRRPLRPILCSTG